MTVQVSSDLVEALRCPATEQGRDLESLVEEAVRNYLAAAAITDVEPGEIGETQK